MELEENLVKKPPLENRITNNRWLWLGLTVVLLGSSAVVVVQSVQQAGVIQAEIEQANKTLTSHEQLVKRSVELEAALSSCVGVVSTRIEQLEAFKGALTVINNEYRNMYHSGLGNVNTDAYIDALNDVAAITTVLDGQVVEVCDAN